MFKNKSRFYVYNVNFKVKLIILRFILCIFFHLPCHLIFSSYKTLFRSCILTLLYWFTFCFLSLNFVAKQRRDSIIIWISSFCIHSWVILEQGSVGYKFGHFFRLWTKSIWALNLFFVWYLFSISYLW